MSIIVRLLGFILHFVYPPTDVCSLVREIHNDAYRAASHGNRQGHHGMDT